MGLTFVTLRQQQEEALPNWTADRRLWLTSDRSRAVEDGDPEAAFQLVAPGQQITERDAKKYGLLVEKAAEAPTEKVKSKPADKSVRPKPNKEA
jgi:hypothetical protein